MIGNEGYFLIEVLLGMFLLGLLAISILPIIQGAINNFIFLEKKIDMNYLAESIIEHMKAFDFNDCEEKYILDIKLMDLMDLLCEKDVVELSLPLDTNSSHFRYNVVINKKNIEEKLWKVIVKVEQKNYRGRIKNVFYETCMPMPEKQ